MTLAWYFSTADKKLRYGDGRKIVVGKSHIHRGEPVLCTSGLHASVRILDAMEYAPGPILYRVKLGGRVDIGMGKVCATKRTYLASVDATDLLRDFARKCALDVIHLWNAPEIVREYLETGREDIRAAARVAAEAAARGDAWAAARDAARVAARAAAWDAARVAARAAAWAAARVAAEAAARGDARAAARDAARVAAEAAARGDARDAARDAQNARITEMARSAMGLGDSE